MLIYNKCILFTDRLENYKMLLMQIEFECLNHENWMQYKNFLHFNTSILLPGTILSR